MSSQPRHVRLDKVESWLDEYGNQLLGDIYRITRDKTTSEEVILRAFVAAFEKTKRNRVVDNRFEWLLALCLQYIDSTLPDNPSGAVTGDIDSSGASDLIEMSAAEHVRVRKTLQAAALLEEVEQNRRAGLWLRLAIGTTVVIGLAAVIVGIYRPNHTNSVRSKVVKDAVSLPIPLQNLPVSTIGQYVLPVDAQPNPLEKYVVGSDFLYNSTLRTAKSNESFIDISRGALSTDGKQLSDTMKPFSTVSLTPPPINTGYWPRALLLPDAVWHLSDWSFDTVNQWGVVAVNWARTSSSHDEACQVYVLNLTTHQLVYSRSWVPVWHLANEYSVHIGGNRIIVEPALSGSSRLSGANLAALPIQLYTIAKNGNGVLTQVGQLTSNFGYGESPTVMSGGILFQSLVSDETSNSLADQLDSTWYKVSWNGQLTKLAGPPLDGQPHWALRGESGQLWWAETTPDMSSAKQHVQVVMAPLSPETSGESQADTLSGAVLAFSVSNEDVLWVQDVGGTKELVVSSAQ